MSKKTITQRIVQYFEDPKESNALAEIKRLSEQAKNKSSKNLIRIDTTIDRPDINTEINTKLNRKMFKENNNKKFQRRKYQFPTQIFQPSIVNDLKRKALKKLKIKMLRNMLISLLIKKIKKSLKEKIPGNILLMPISQKLKMK